MNTYLLIISESSLNQTITLLNSNFDILYKITFPYCYDDSDLKAEILKSYKSIKDINYQVKLITL